MSKILKKVVAEKKIGAAKSSAQEPAGTIGVGAGVIHKRVLDARAEAQAVLQEAKTRAEAIRARAEAELSDAKAKKEEAIKRGYMEGESKGLAKVTEKLIELERIKERFYESAEPEVMKLVTSVAEKVIGRMAAENREMIKSVVALALERSLGDRVTVRLNPEDYRNIAESGGGFKDTLDRTKRIAFRADDSITKGGCTVETEVGTIDARIETQMDAIKKALTNP